MIVGHILVGLMLHMEMVWHVNPAVYLYTMVPLAIILPLAMLPSIKGASSACNGPTACTASTRRHRGLRCNRRLIRPGISLNIASRLDIAANP